MEKLSNPDVGSSSQITVSEFLEFINCEINSIRVKTDRPGWTLWALAAAIVSLLWLLIGLLEAQEFSLDGIRHWFLALFFFQPALQIVVSIIDSDAFCGKGSSRFYLANKLFNSNRSAAVLNLVISVLISVWISNAEWHSILFILIIVYTTLVLEALSNIIALIISFIPMPIPKSTPTASRALIIGMTVMYMTSGLSFLILAISEGIDSINYAELKIGGLSFGILYLFRIILNIRRPPILLKSLEEIRRSLALGKSDLSSSIRQADVALLGLKVADVLQNEIEEYIQLSSEYNERCVGLRKKLSIAGETLEGIPDGAEDDHPGVIVLLSLVNDMTADTEKNSEISERMFKLLDRTERITRLMERANTGIGEEIDEIWSMMREEAEASAQHRKVLLEELSQFMHIQDKPIDVEPRQISA